MSRQLSPDGNYYWDGVAWRLVPRRAAGPRRRTAPIIVAVAVIAAFLVTGLVVLGIVRIVIGAQQSLQRQLVPSCAANANPGRDLAEGDTLCGFRLGTQELSAPCVSGKVPQDLRVWQRIGTTAVAQPATIQVDASGCDLAVPAGQEMWLETATSQPADVIAVADYVPSTDWGITGIELACTRDSCVKLSIDPAGVYRIDELRIAGGWHNAARGALPLATISRLDESNRVVLRYRDRAVQVYLDGFFVVAVKTGEDHNSGFLTFYMTDTVGGQPAEVHLRELEVFAAA